MHYEVSICSSNAAEELPGPVEAPQKCAGTEGEACVDPQVAMLDAVDGAVAVYSQVSDIPYASTICKIFRIRARHDRLIRDRILYGQVAQIRNCVGARRDFQIIGWLPVIVPNCNRSRENRASTT